MKLVYDEEFKAKKKALVRKSRIKIFKSQYLKMLVEK